MKTTKIMLVDDHAILRAGLNMLISDERDMKIIGEAGSGQEAIEGFKKWHPDITILDITLPDMNGLDVVKKIKELNPDAKILILTMHDNVNYLKEFTKAGVSGYVLKKSADVELINAIRAVRENRMFVDQSFTSLILGPDQPIRKLSHREEEVLKLLARGYTSKEIAVQLKVSIKTVETYRNRISEKLNISSRYELVQYAIKNGLFNPAIE